MLRPKGMPYLGWTYIKGKGFQELKYRTRLRHLKGQKQLLVNSFENFKGVFK